MGIIRLTSAAGIAVLMTTSLALAGAKSVTPGVSSPSATVATGPVATQSRPGSGRLHFVLIAPR